MSAVERTSDPFASHSLAHVRGLESGDPAALSVYEPSSYLPSTGVRPLAFLASAGAILAIAAALMTLNIVASHKAQSHLTTIEVRDLDVVPPPPPPATTLEAAQAAKAEAVVPKPTIELPSTGPLQVMLDVPPPPTPTLTASEGAKTNAPVAAAVAPAAATTLEGGDLASKVLFAKPPTYPTESRRAREQGTVKLLVLVGADGKVADISVAGSSGSQRLDRAALQAVRRWRWSPTMRDGSAMPVRGYVTIPFVLVAA